LSLPHLESGVGRCGTAETKNRNGGMRL